MEWDGRGFHSTHLIVSPTQKNVVQSTVRLVHAVLGRVHGIPRVRVILERLRVYDLVRKLAPYHERVSDDIPLALGPKEEQELSQIVDEPSDLHPFGLSVSSDSFCGLQQMFDLRNGRLNK
jgi:hypothetical protein